MSTPPAIRPHLAVIVAAGAVLAWHAAAGPHLYDAGELVAAAWVLGGSHPPGQPLHALLGHALALVPLGPIVLRVALLSVAGELAAAWLVGQITALLLRAADAPARLPVRLAPDAAMVAALLAPPLLRQAARPEVYGLALALTLASALFALRWARRARPSRDAFASALCVGLAAAVHPPHGLAAGLFCVVVAVAARRDLLVNGRAITLSAAALVLGLAVVVFLPIRAYAGAPMWGDPSTWHGFTDYVAASAYRHNLKGTSGSVLATLGDVTLYALLAAGVLPALGAVALARATRTAGGAFPRIALGALVGSAVMLLAACLQPLEERNPDNVAYAAPAVALLIASGAAGFASLARRGAYALPAAVLLCVLALNSTSVLRASEALDASVPALETLSGSLVDSPPPRALVVAETDFVAASLMQSQTVDGARPDFALFVTGLATSSWHWRTLTHHPCFDGAPRRGAGRDARERYVNGAIQAALGRVAVASEPSWPLRGAGSVCGAYLMLPMSELEEPPAVLDSCIGERVERVLASDVLGEWGGDHDAAASVWRAHGIERAHRLAVRSRGRDALLSLARAEPRLPLEERAQMRAEPDAPLVRRPPPVVRDPHAFLASYDDVAHEAAALLWGLGDSTRARALLQHATERGDSRALLQLGWILLAEGNAADATRARDEFVARAPFIASEADDLDAALGRSRD